MIIRFNAHALRELREAEWYIERQRPRWGSKFRAAVDATLEHILQRLATSRSYRRIGSGSEKVERFPYRVYYKVVGDELWIRAVYHSRRKEGGWKRRKLT